MNYKIGDRVLHDSGWSAVIKSGTNETGFTIEFDGCVIPENSEPLIRGPQDQYKMMGVFGRNLKILPQNKICSIEDIERWRKKVDSAWQKELQEHEQYIQKINKIKSRKNSKSRRSRSKSSRSSRSS
jgi:hypothetical protein